MLELVDIRIHTALPGHFQLSSCPCWPTPTPSFPGSLLPFPLILIPPSQLFFLPKHRRRTGERDLLQHPNPCPYPPLPHHCGNVHVLAALEGGENEVLEEKREKAR